MTRNFFNNFIRSLFSTIDYFIYSSIKWVTQGIFDIAELRTNVSIVETVRTKIYIILGIFMLFKISVSLINYMINPDQMTDKDKGATKLISRTITMLVMLILLPTIFTLIYRVQSAFLPMIPRLVLGTNDTASTDGNGSKNTEKEITNNVAEHSDAMAVTLLQAFFHPYYSEEATEGEYYYASIDGAKEIKSLDDFVQHVNDGNAMAIPLLGKTAGYSYEYRFLLSTVVGIVVLGLLVGITIDVAVRLFKMLILEMLAPIPIMSYIDPKSQKDGPFQSWLKELSKTFLDIFIKLGLIYLVLFFVAELQDDNLFVTYGSAEGANISPLRLMYLRVFIIIGLLVFLKQASKFVKSILGIKDSKDGGSFLGNVVGGLAGFGTGAISGAISGRGLRGAITGGITGMAAGYQGAASGKGANAWQAGGDAALQARIGDKNAKSGVLATLQRKASSSQMKASAARLGLTEQSVDAAKSNWLNAQAEATQAEWNYRDLIARGPNAGESEADYNTRRAAAYNDWQEKVTRSSDAERNYQKGKEAYEKNYGQEQSAYAKYSNGTVHRASKRVKEGAEGLADNITTSLGGSTIERRREERTSRISNNGGFDPNK